MANDLRERLRRGDLTAFLDQALELHLFAAPDEGWWWDGANALVWALRESVTAGTASAGLGPAALAKVLVRWSARSRRDPWGIPTMKTHLGLARSLRRMLPFAMPEADAALAVLGRYAHRTHQKKRPIQPKGRVGRRYTRAKCPGNA